MAVAIKKAITCFSVKKPEEVTPEVAEAPQVVQMHEALERPEFTEGATYKIKTPLDEHALYVTINDVVLNEGTEHERRVPFEIFINSKNMEHYQWIVALTRVMSAVFRKGGDVTFLVEEMKAVFDPRGGYWAKGGKYHPSLVANIGEVIERHMKRIGLLAEDALSEEQKALIAEKRAQYAGSGTSEQPAFPPEATVCSKCHTKAVIRMDGCDTCLNCGASKCG